MNNKIIAGIAGAGILAVALVLLFGNRETEPKTQTHAAAKEVNSTESTQIDSDSQDSSLRSSAPIPDIPLTVQEESTESTTYNGMDPELQPRAFYVRNFLGSWKLPEGFLAEGIIATPEGLQLAPGEGDGLRQGTILSPAEPFDFPSNALAPLWKENVPEGTDVMVEMQVSPNGEDWGAWQYIGIDNDSHGQIAQFYPDGTPNPNYGHTPGGLLVWGNLQFTHMRYRITMVSENENTPTIEAFRGFYQDSTMGEGTIASVADLSTDLIETANPINTKPGEEIIYNPTYKPEEHLEQSQQTERDVKRVP
ncbi:MAG: hypothetical protein SFY68_07825 [Candidatus Sumerlaeia bacterium]|nr:hypothetical protein [Candidatus Sumerlaeia bacterium]